MIKISAIVTHPKKTKWALVSAEDGAELFSSNSRVKCFRYAYSKDIKIIAYSHGEKPESTKEVTK